MEQNDKYEERVRQRAIEFLAKSGARFDNVDEIPIKTEPETHENRSPKSI